MKINKPYYAFKKKDAEQMLDFWFAKMPREGKVPKHDPIIVETVKAAMTYGYHKAIEDVQEGRFK